MIKFLPASDLHLDELKNPLEDCLIYPEEDTDLIIIAGDLGEGFSQVEWAKHYSKKNRVLYLTGNHCIYGSSIGKKEEKLRERFSGFNIDVISKGYIEINDYVIICATLWTDFSLFPDRVKEAKLDYDLTMKDRKKIKTRTYQRLFANNMQKLSIEHRQFIANTLDKFKDRKCIIVTHHAPSISSIPDELKEDIDAVCYANDMDKFILSYPQIKAWIHGHIHHSSDYYIGDKRIICNPFKAIFFEDSKVNKNWNPRLNIQLP